MKNLIERALRRWYVPRRELVSWMSAALAAKDREEETQARMNHILEGLASARLDVELGPPPGDVKVNVEVTLTRQLMLMQPGPRDTVRREMARVVGRQVEERLKRSAVML